MNTTNKILKTTTTKSKKDLLQILRLPKNKNLSPVPMTQILHEMRYGG